MAVMTVLQPVQRFATREFLQSIANLIITVVGAIMWGIGWVPAKAFRTLWIAGLWSIAAIKLGWKDGLASGLTRQDQ